MDKETWMQKLAEELKKRLGDEYHLGVEDGQVETSLNIQKEGELTGIRVRVSVCDEWLCREDKLSDAADVMQQEYEKLRSHLSGSPLFGRDFESMRHMVVYALEKRAGNEEALEHIPYEEFLDMVIVFELHLHADDMHFRRVINNEDMKQWGIHKQDLLEAAEQNTPAMYPPLLGLAKAGGFQKGVGGMKADELTELFSPITEVEDSILLVLTSEKEQYGAGCILYDGILEDIADFCQDDLVIFITSAYEVLLFPYRGNHWTVEQWLDVVAKMEQLKGLGLWSFSDSVYRYDRTEKQIKFVKHGMEQTNGLVS